MVLEDPANEYGVMVARLDSNQRLRRAFNTAGATTLLRLTAPIVQDPGHQTGLLPERPRKGRRCCFYRSASGLCSHLVIIQETQQGTVSVFSKFSRGTPSGAWRRGHHRLGGRDQSTGEDRARSSAGCYTEVLYSAQPFTRHRKGTLAFRPKA